MTEGVWLSRFRKDQGKFGEDAAVEYLEKQGYTILERNFTIRGGEIDIIAIDAGAGSGSISFGEEVLVFVEVKTRRSSEFGDPLESITPWKLRALKKAAEYYKLTHRDLPDAMRIDAIAIILTDANKIATIDLVKNIS